MGRTGRLTLALAVAALGSLPLRAQTSTVCEALASRLRAAPDIVAGTSQDDPLVTLARGSAPIVETARPPTLRLTNASPEGVTTFVDTFNASFSPSAALLASVRELLSSSGTEVFSLPASDLHLVVNTAGTAICQYFVFFRAEPGREAQPVREPFSRETMAFCYNDSGVLARVAGVPAFVEYTQPITGGTYMLRVFPWQNGEWGVSCSVTAEFDTRYEVADVFVPDRGPLREAAIRAVATDIARRRDAARESPYPSLAGGVPPQDLEAIQTLRQDGSARVRELPTFGRRNPERLDASHRVVQDGELLPIVIQGRTFAINLAHASIGWRTFPDWLMIFYSLDTGAVAPVGSAIVTAHRGALKNVRVDR